MLLAVQNRLVMFGGCNFNAHACYNETHVYEPSVSVHVAHAWQLLVVVDVHSSMLTQLTPSPE